MAQAKKIKLSGINHMLPPELLEKILQNLNYKEIYLAQLVCKKWKIVAAKSITQSDTKVIFKLATSYDQIRL